MGRFHKSNRKSGSGPKRPALTHFLCLPLVTNQSRPQLQAALDRFRKEVQPPTRPSAESRSTTENLDESDANANEIVQTIHFKAIRPVGTLHCTLGVMSLDHEKLEEAVAFLQGLDVNDMLEKSKNHVPDRLATPTPEPQDSPSQGEPSMSMKTVSPPFPVDKATSPLRINLTGLESMHAPHRTSILYSGPHDSSHRMYYFCEALRNAFQERDFLVKDDRELKLHATIVNTIYAKGRGKQRSGRQRTNDRLVDNVSAAGTEGNTGPEGHGPNANAPLKLDARDILAKYRDFVWAKDIVLDRVAICEMGAKKKFNDEGVLVAEEYTEVAAIHLPS